MIQLVVGPAKVGKTAYCYTGIQSALEEDAYHNLIMLVPDQFNLQVQIELAKRLSPGLLRVEVMSFNNLAERILKEVGGAQEPLIDDLERVMILKKLLEDHRGELKYFKKGYNSEGFIDGMNRLITIFEQNAIDGVVLQDLMSKEEVSEVFKCKLEDMAHIREWFENYIADKFMTSEKTMERLAKAIHKSRYLQDAVLWVDGFYGFTVPQMQVLEEMMLKVKDMTLTLPMDKLYTQEEYVLANNPFAESIYTYQAFLKLCDTNHLKHRTLFKQSEASGVTPFEYLKDHYLKAYVHPYTETQDAIQLFSYGSKEDEVEQTARRIKELVRDKGYRYNEIAVLVGDLNMYRSTLLGSFKEYDIPVFIDDKKSIHTNALVAVMTSALEVLAGRWTYKSMMSLLRLDMLGIEREVIDTLDNYLLAHGIQGEAKWRMTWTYQDDVVQADEINPVREQIVDLLDTLKVALDTCKQEKGYLTIADATIALYHFLEKIEAEQCIEERVRYYEEVGELARLQEHQQIYSQIVETLERLVALLGSEKITLRAYNNLLKTSFSYVKMGVIPASKDQTLVGTVDRTRLPHVKALFVLGVNEGVIPKIDDSMNLFSEMDKLTLETLNQQTHAKKDRLADVLVNQPLYASNFTLYALLTTAKVHLFISTVGRDTTGKTLRPSMVFYKLKKMFGQQEPDIKPIDAVQTPIPTMSYVGGELRRFLEQGEEDAVDATWQQTMSWYMEQEAWRDKIIGIAGDLVFTNQQHYLHPDNAKLLYPNGFQTSVSQLETYRQCPCCYFIKYGMKASERKLFEWNAADLGTLFHDTLERYPEELKLIGRTWVEVNEDEMQGCVEKAVAYSAKQAQEKITIDGRMKYTLSKVTKMTKRAISALTYQLKQGEFIPYQYEVDFGYEGMPPIQIAIDEEHTILLKGKIDRVDIYMKDTNEQYIKILDYKSGSTSFNLLEVYHALQFQLLLYLDAYLRTNPNYKAAGMFYFHINSKNIKYELGMGEDALQEKQIKQFKLSGLALDDIDIIRLMDEHVAGEIVPAKLKKDGSLSATSSVASEKQFELLRTYMLEQIKGLGRDMLKGKISARPYKLKSKDGCSYCKYHTICQFDTAIVDNEYEQLAELNNKQIWEAVCLNKEKGDA